MLQMRKEYLSLLAGHTMKGLVGMGQTLHQAGLKVKKSAGMMKISHSGKMAKGKQNKNEKGHLPVPLFILLLH